MITAGDAFEAWWQGLPLRDGTITADHIRQAWDAGLMFERNRRRSMDMKEFYRSWSIDHIPQSVLDEGCNILDEADLYDPEKVVHRIVLVTLKAWINASA